MCDATGRSALAITGGRTLEFDQEHAWISPNGMWLLVGKASRYGALLGRTSFQLKRIHLPTGATEQLNIISPAEFGDWVASDGTVLGLAQGNNGFFTKRQLVSPNQKTADLGDSAYQQFATLADANARIILDGQSRQEKSADSRTLMQCENFPSYSPVTKEYLQLVLVDGACQIKLQKATNAPGFGLPSTILTNHPGGFRRARLSGNGRWAAAVFEDGTLGKVDLATGSSTILAPSPYLAKLPDYILHPGGGAIVEHAPAGSSVWLTNTGAPRSADQLRVWVGGKPAPILERTQTGNVRIQIPWEAADGAELETDQEITLQWDQSDWEVAFPIRVCQRCPFLGEPIHGDWRGLVTEQDPAEAGEFVHFYATGLGKVSPEVPTGSLPPTYTQITTTNPCTATLTPALPPLPVENRLDPTYVGFFIATIQIPPNNIPKPARLNVQLDCGGNTRDGIPGFLLSGSTLLFLK